MGMFPNPKNRKSSSTFAKAPWLARRALTYFMAAEDWAKQVAIDRQDHTFEFKDLL